MTAKTHKLFGLATGLAVLSVPGVRDFLATHTTTVNEAVTAGALFETGCYFGSTVSDADSKESTAGWWLYPFLRSFYLKDRSGLAPMFNHRHLFHNIGTVLLFLMLGGVTSSFSPVFISVIPIGFALGITSHIFSDWVMSKVYFLSPFSEKGFSLLHLEGEENAEKRKVCDKIFWVFSLLANMFLVAKEVVVW